MNVLEGAEADLALRYVKHRWRGAVNDARAGELALVDVDLDPDWGELLRAVGPAALEAVAIALLELEAPPADDARVVRALAPELAPDAGRALLSFFGLNVAFRARSDAALRALARSPAAAGLPRPAPEAVGRLLSRARSSRAARALVEGAGLPPALRAQVEAAVAPVEPPPPGARLHLEAEPDAALRALKSALSPAREVPWSQAGSAARRLLLLRRTGGWITVLDEQDALSRELVPALARTGGVRRAAWSRFGGGAPDLLVHEGTRAVLDAAALPSRDEDEAGGALRALGVLDLDPDHPRGRTPLRYAEHIGGGPPLGVERRLRKKGIRAVAFEEGRAPGVSAPGGGG